MVTTGYTVASKIITPRHQPSQNNETSNANTAKSAHSHPRIDTIIGKSYHPPQTTLDITEILNPETEIRTSHISRPSRKDEIDADSRLLLTEVHLIDNIIITKRTGQDQRQLGTGNPDVDQKDQTDSRHTHVTGPQRNFEPNDPEKNHIAQTQSRHVKPTIMTPEKMPLHKHHGLIAENVPEKTIKKVFTGTDSQRGDQARKT